MPCSVSAVVFETCAEIDCQWQGRPPVSRDAGEELNLHPNIINNGNSHSNGNIHVHGNNNLNASVLFSFII